MAKQYTTTRIWNSTIRNLRLVSAISGETMVVVLERLVVSELDKLGGHEFVTRENENVKQSTRAE